MLGSLAFLALLIALIIFSAALAVVALLASVYRKPPQSPPAYKGPPARFSSFADTYGKVLRTLLQTADWFIGLRFTLPALAACISIAFCYTSVSFFIAWTFGAPGGIGDQLLFSPGATRGQSLAIGALALLSLIFLAGVRFLVRDLSYPKSVIDSAILRARPRLPSIIAFTVLMSLLLIGSAHSYYLLLAMLLIVCLLIAAFVVYFLLYVLVESRNVGSGLGAGSLALVGGAIFCGAIFIWGAELNGLFFLGALGAVLVGSILVNRVQMRPSRVQRIGEGNMWHKTVGEVATSIILIGVGAAMWSLFTSQDSAIVFLIVLFLFILPTVNGFWDFCSLGISQWLGYRLLRRFSAGGRVAPSFMTIAGHLLLDLGGACLTLCGLVWITGLVVGLYEASYFGTNEASQVREVIAGATAGGAIWIWIGVLLGSTLLPTLLHGAALMIYPVALAFRQVGHWEEVAVVAFLASLVGVILLAIIIALLMSVVDGFSFIRLALSWLINNGIWQGGYLLRLMVAA